MTRRDYAEFRLYLKACTDNQVYGVWEKEFDAGRHDYAALAVAELDVRNLTPPEEAIAL